MSGIEGTFGNSPAAITLAKITYKDEKLFGKLAKSLSTLDVTLRELSKLDRKIRLGIANMVLHKYKTLAEAYPEDCKTYFSNVISMKYKVWLKKQRSQVL